jgi:hypothetical protein
MKRFLFPGVEGEEEENIVVIDDDGGEDPPPADDDDDGGEDPPPADDDIPAAKQPSRAQQEIIKLRERAQKAEEDIKKAREEIESFKKKPDESISEEKRLWDEEEAALKNPNIQEWQKYAITATRSSRRAEKLAFDLKMQGVDIRDKMEFDSLKAEKPGVYEKYSSEVEKRYQEFYQKGTIVPRRMICANLLGEDMLSGKIKTKKSPPVNRGETPGARSDAPRASSSGGRNSPEAIAKRLENIPI